MPAPPSTSTSRSSARSGAPAGADDRGDAQRAGEDRRVRGGAALGGDDGAHPGRVEQGGVRGREVAGDEHERLRALGHPGHGGAGERGDDPVPDVQDVPGPLGHVAAQGAQLLGDLAGRLPHRPLRRACAAPGPSSARTSPASDRWPWPPSSRAAPGARRRPPPPRRTGPRRPPGRRRRSAPASASASASGPSVAAAGSPAGGASRATGPTASPGLTPTPRSGSVPPAAASLVMAPREARSGCSLLMCAPVDDDGSRVIMPRPGPRRCGARVPHVTHLSPLAR